MKKLSFFLAFLMILTLAMGAYAQECKVEFSDPTNTWDDGGTLKLIPGATHQIEVLFTSTGCFSPTNPNQQGMNVGNAFKIYSPDGMDWVFLNATIDGGGAIFSNPADVKWSQARSSKFFFDLAEPGNTNGWNLTADSIDQTVLFPAGPLIITAAAPGIGATDSAVVNVTAFTQAPQQGGVKHPLDNTMMYTIEFGNAGVTSIPYGTVQGTICFDTVTTTPAKGWEWVYLEGPTSVFPTWIGEVCWVVEKPLVQPPVLGPCPGPTSVNHCDDLVLEFTASPNPSNDEDFLPFHWTATVNGNPDGSFVETNQGQNATFTWTPDVQEGFATVYVTVEDDQGNVNETGCTIEVTITNEGPTIACPGGAPTVKANNPYEFDLAVSDDCDDLTITPSGTYDGTVDIVGNHVTFTPTEADEGVACVTFTVSDELETDQCEQCFTVLTGAPYFVEIEKIHDAIQGQFVDVDVTLTGFDPNEGLGGFDLLIAYDNSALSFQQATEGDIYDLCGWEYFTYRFGADGNCGNGCPSGLTRLIGFAESNNGPHHPDEACLIDGIGYVPATMADNPVSLATLRFLVSNDRSLECQYVPIRFFWIDCGDNTLSNFDGTALFISDKVFDYNNPDPIQDGGFGFPGYLGASDYCLTQEDEVYKIRPERNVDFQNGGVDIVCADSIDARGDINLNGLAYEIADAVMFTTYFIEGLDAFCNPAISTPCDTQQYAATAASDANADGIPLTVGDLVYLIRVVVGDALPYPKLNPTYATYAVENGVMSVSSEMGAAHVVLNGSANVDLLADNMEMITGKSGDQLNVLVYSTEANQAFSGNFLAVDGDVISVDFATYEGQPVAAKNVPRSFRVEQNYPNPFNPTTMIEFAIPSGGEWTVDIYNVAGQRVNTFTGVAEPGIVSVEWDASDLASGVYFYRVAAGQNVKTMKAMLLK